LRLATRINIINKNNMDKKLYVLPFDHRGSFIKMFGFSDKTLTEDQTSTLMDYKHVIYESFLAALGMGVSKDDGAILVDEQFGSKIQEEARAAGITRIITTEKSGLDEFDFEYGSAFGEHINKFKPDYVKVLVRYNPEGDKEGNLRQIEKLKIMNDFCRANKYGFLFELLAVPTEKQLSDLGGDKEKYEKILQGKVMKEAIKEIQDGGIEPDVWKLEGLENFDDMRQVVEQVRANGRENVGVVVLGRGESDAKVRIWLSVAASIPGVIGFAVGRTVFKQPLTDYHNKILTRAQAVEAIAKNYKGFVNLFESSKK
jgi:myo-inositol catabolism protein IolC